MDSMTLPREVGCSGHTERSLLRGRKTHDGSCDVRRSMPSRADRVSEGTHVVPTRDTLHPTPSHSETANGGSVIQQSLQPLGW